MQGHYFTFATSCRLVLTQPAHPRTHNRCAVATVPTCISYSVLRQVHDSHFQSEFPRQCDLVLPLSNSSIFQLGHPVVAYNFFHVFPSLYVFFHNVFQQAVPTIQLASLLSHCMQYIALLLSCLCQWQVPTFQVSQKAVNFFAS